MERKSLAACGKPTIAESAPTTLQAMRAALSDRQLGWNSRGVSSLLTVWRLPNSISGCRGQIEMLSHSSQTQGGQKNRDIVYALPTLNTSLCLAAT